MFCFIISTCCIKCFNFDFMLTLQKKLFEGRWFFKCQNGLTECMKNKWQACSIHVLPSKLQLLAKYLVCYMSSTVEMHSGYQVRIIFALLIWHSSVTDELWYTKLVIYFHCSVKFLFKCIYYIFYEFRKVWNLLVCILYHYKWLNYKFYYTQLITINN